MAEAISYLVVFLIGMYVMHRISKIRNEDMNANWRPNSSSALNGPYAVGETVWIKECWGDDTWARYDEIARITDISDEGELELVWIDVPDAQIRAYLEEATFTVEDISGYARVP
jgi:hypothetical protein